MDDYLGMVRLLAQNARRTHGMGNIPQKAAAGFKAAEFIRVSVGRDRWLTPSFNWKISIQTLSWRYPNQEVTKKVAVVDWSGYKIAGI